MGVFRKNKDKNGKPTGPWYVQYPASRDAKGKIKYKTLKASWQKKVAKEMLRKKQDEFNQAERLGITATREMTFSELMDWGLSQEVMKAKVTASDDVARSKLLTDYFGDEPATKVTPLMVDNFRVKMKNTVSEHTKKPYSGTTVNRMVALGRRVYNLALDDGLVPINPFARRGAFKEHSAGKYIPDEDFRAMLPHLPGHIKPVVLTAYLSGMRAGEVISLTWDRVDLHEGVIDLSAEDTKTGEPRLIYLNAMPELRKVFVEAALKQTKAQELVFTKPNGEPIPKWGLRKPFLKACKLAGVGPYRFHDLRHTFNTNMVKAGVSKTTIMKLTGHKTLSMFLRYAHLDREQSETAMQRLGEFLSMDNGANKSKVVEA
jgi:integrase